MLSNIDKMRLTKFSEDVKDEVSRACGNYPFPNPNLAALMEEVGELARAMLENKSALHIWEEAVQVATMAARCAIEGDPQFLKRVRP